MHRSVIARIGFVLVVLADCLLLPADGQAKGVFYPCHRIGVAPKIDGVPDEPAWEAAEPIPFADIVSGAPAPLPSTAKMVWDDQCLYVAFTMEDSNVWAGAVVRDAPAQPGFTGYTENFAKLFFDPDGDGRRYTEMHVTPAGAIDDKWQALPWQARAREALGLPLDEPNRSHWEWTCEGLRSAVSIQGTLNDPTDVDQGWTLELAIPFTALKQFAGTQACPPKEDDLWRLHLGRRYAGQGATNTFYWTWPIVGEEDCHRVDTWAYLVFRGLAPEPAIAAFDTLPKAVFASKMLWVRNGDMKAGGGPEKTAAHARRMGFTAIAAPPDTNLAVAAHREGLEFYAWMVNLTSPECRAFLKLHPEFAQAVTPLENALAGQARIDPDRENVHPSNWLCPDRGLTDTERDWIARTLQACPVDGIALDYIGYRNYYACFCPHSVSNRAAYVVQHPGLSRAQALGTYSEDSLVRYTGEIRDCVRRLDPRLKLAIHIYPDFDPNPLYAARLPVEWCGQTVAWFFKPFWSYPHQARLVRRYSNSGRNRAPTNRFVPFVGAYGGERMKTPDRLRTEIRIAGTAGTRAIMFAFYGVLLENPALASVLEEEFR